MHEQGDTAARVVQLLTGLLTATDRAAADPRGVLASLGGFLFRSFQDSSQASELLAQWQQQPADPSLQTAVMDVIAEALRANPEFKTGLLSALNLAEQPTVAQPAEPSTTTVAAGRDQKLRGNVNIGSGVLTVNRQRTIRLGLGSALAVLLVGGVTTGVVYLRQGDRAAPQSAGSPPSVPSAAAKPLSTVPPTSLDTSIATIKMTDYAHDDTTIYGFVSDSDFGMRRSDLTATAIATGKPRWSVRLPGSGATEESTPKLVTANGKSLVAVPYYDTVPGHGTTPGYEYLGIMAVDTQAGSVAWHSEVQQFRDSSTRHQLPDVSLIGGGSVLAVSWQGGSPALPPMSAVVDATNAKVLWKKAGFVARVVESGVAAGYMRDSTWATDPCLVVGLAAADGHRLWQLDKQQYEPSVQLAAPGVLLAHGRLRAGLDEKNVTQLLDASSGAKKMEFIDRDAFYSKAQSDKDVIFLEGTGIAAYGATSFQRLWALPDPAANRVSLRSVGALWHGALYGYGADNRPAMLDARTGADEAANLPFVPTALVPGYALCDDGYSVQVYPIK